MTDAKITQLGQQGVVKGNPDARVTQEALQTVTKEVATARVTQQGVQSVVRVAPEPPVGEARLIETRTSSDTFVDPHWKNVTLLLNGGSGLRDRSRYNTHGTAGRARGPFPDTVNQRFGPSLSHFETRGWGALFYAKDRRIYNFGRKPFTIECWVRAPSGTGVRGIANVYDTGSNRRSWALLLVNNAITFYGSVDGSLADLILTGPNLVANTWTHICVDRDATGVVRLYVNGVFSASALFNQKFNDTTLPLLFMKHDFGSEETSGQCLNGNVNDLRITRNVARYGSDLGFVVPTSAYPYKPFNDPPTNEDVYWDYVTCLINGNQNPIIDLKRGATVTGVTQRPLLNEGQAVNQTLLGPGTVAHIDSQWDLAGRSEPFTLEWCGNHTSRGGNSGIVLWEIPNSLRTFVSRGGIFVDYWNGSAWIRFFEVGHFLSGLDNDTALQSCALTRDEFGVWRFYRVGQFVGSAMQPTTMGTAPATNLSISAVSEGGLDNIRMTWGVARYTTDGPMQDSLAHLPYRLTGPAAPALPAATYPYDLGFPKAAGETLIRFQTSLGAAPTIVNKYNSGVIDENKPDWFRWMAGAATRVRNNWSVAIPEQFHADVDSGLVYLDFGGEGASVASVGDHGALIAGTRTNFAGTPNEVAVSNVVKAAQFEPLTGRMLVQPGSRTISLGFMAYRSGITFQFLYRNVYARLTKNEPATRFDLPTITVSDWVDAKGGIPIISAPDWNLNTVVTTGKTMELRRTFDLPAGINTQIDNGEAAFRFEGMAVRNSADTNDFGRSYVEFLDATDTVVGTRKWDSQTPYIPQFLQKVDIASPIPPTARKAVVGIFGSKDYQEAAGTTQVSFHVALASAHCYLPGPGEMPVAATPAPVVVADPHWDNVHLLLSTRNGVIENLADFDTRRITVNGAIAVSSIASPFGTTAISSNLGVAAIGTDWIEIELYGPDIGPAMTFEGWFMKTGRTTRTWEGIHSQLGNGADQPATPMRLDNTARSDVQLAFGEWYHLALCRDETGRGKMFVNGVLQNIQSPAYTTLWNRLFRLAVYNAADGNQSSWVGYFDEIRITNGVERYTENFIPQANRFPTTNPPRPLLLSGDTGSLLLTGESGELILNEG